MAHMSRMHTDDWKAYTRKQHRTDFVHCDLSFWMSVDLFTDTWSTEWIGMLTDAEELTVYLLSKAAFHA